MVRRSGVDDVLAPWQFERLFKTAASIKDLELAVEMAYLLYTPCRFGPRNSEVLHITDEWFVRNAWGNIVGVRVPTAVPDCECNICQSLAKDRAEDDDDPDATAEDYLDEYWRPKSHAGGRTIPVLQERGRELLELYGIKHTAMPNMIGQTYRNRLNRLEELCDAVDVNLYPQAGRATCANYWAYWDVDPKFLRQLMGWKYISTAQYYLRKSDVDLRWKMQEALGREPTVPYEIYNEPPTFFDVRPDDPDELIEVERLTPESARSSSSSSPSSPDPLEEHAQVELDDEQQQFDDYAADPVSAVVGERLRTEREAAVESDVVDYPPPPKRAAATALGLSLLALVIGVGLALSGTFWIDPVGGEVHATPGATIGFALGAALIYRDLPEL